MKATGNNNINTEDYWNTVYGTLEKRKGYASQGTDSNCVLEGKRTLRFDRALQEVKANDKFIDIGCGVGVMTNLVKSTYPDCEVWGTDISKKVIEDNISENPSIKYLHGVVGEQNFLPKKYFDVVFSGEVLEHLDNPVALLKEAYSILKDDGKCIITTPLQDSIQSPEHTWFFTQQDVEDLFLRAKFKKIQFVYLSNQEHLMVIFAIGEK